MVERDDGQGPSEARQVPVAGHVIRTVEYHTGGEPVRLIVEGHPVPEGLTILERRRDARERFDGLRRALMSEPRGHADMYGALLVPPGAPGADLGVLFLHNEGFSTMCGHATIAIGRHAVEHGLVPVEGPTVSFVLDCPCGPVEVTVEIADGEVGDVRFRSVPAFAVALDVEVEVAGFGRVRVDLGYGGAFYALVPAAALGLELGSTPVRELTEAAAAVTAAAAAQVRLDHTDADLEFLYGTILTDAPESEPRDVSVNACVFADRQVDRSPTGSGVTARLAVQHARGLAPLGTTRTFESLTGARFTGAVVAEESVAGTSRIVVEVAGRAHRTGAATFEFAADDPLVGGFLLR